MDAPNAKGIPKTCYVPYCDDRMSRRHPLPSDVELCRKWLQNIGNLNLKNLHIENVWASWIVVCERHFSTNDLLAGTEGGLRKEAVPTLFLPSQLETNVVDVCRACMSHANLTNMLELEFEGVDCVQLYETLTSVQVKDTDRISQSLCESCFATLCQFCRFRNNCSRSEKILNDMLVVVKDEKIIHRPISEDHDFSQQTNRTKMGDEMATELPQSFSKGRYSIILESPQADSIGRDKVVRYGLVPHVGGEDNDFTRTNGLSVANANSIVSAECYGMVCDNVAPNSIQSAPDDSLSPNYLDEIISFVVKEIDSNDCDVKNETPRQRTPSNADKSPKTKLRLKDTVVKVFSCFCGINFINHADFFNHRKKEKHFTRCYHACPVCKKNFRDPKRLQDHLNVHAKKKPNVCDTCGKAFALRTSLWRHVQTAHEGQNRFMCDICGREFTTKFAMEDHITNHKGQKPYLCHHCGAQFSYYPTFKLHVKNHADKKGKPKKISKPKEIVKTPSSKNKLHVCVCGKTFRGPSYYIHRKIHSDVRPYSCKFCEKRFVQAGTLKSHVYTHTGERPYKCDVCAKTFTQNVHLKLHTKLHTGEKPFQCTMCDRGFRQKMYLTAHMNGHLGIRPYKCEVCGKGFCDQTTMKKHRKRMHPESK